MSQQRGGYQRSSNGLIGALIVTLLAIGAFVVMRSFVRADVEVEPEPIDYAAAASAARDAGFEVIAPSALPDGWIATAIDLTQTDPPKWGMGVLTADGKFVGLRQEDESVSELVEANVDEDAESGDPMMLDSVVGSEWETWTDEGGDTGYSIEVGDETLLVYGSAPPADLQQFIGLLER